MHALNLTNIELNNPLHPFGFDIFRCKRTLLYIINDFTCANGWKGALQLKRIYPQVKATQTAVFLISNGRYHQAAQQLATRLQLPFPVATHTYDQQINTLIPQRGDNTVLLIEANGRISYSHTASMPETAVRPTQLLSTLNVDNTTTRLHDYPSYMTKDVINAAYV